VLLVWEMRLPLALRRNIVCSLSQLLYNPPMLIPGLREKPCVVLLTGLLALWSAPAVAWEIEDPMHANCHERFTVQILEEVGYRGGGPPMPSHEEEVFIDNQQFDASKYPRNMYALALVLGVRSNDVRGLPDFSWPALAEAANEDQDQPAHCLRRLADDGPQGDEKALARCRDFIEREVMAALDGAVPGDVNPSETVDAEVFIPHVGTITWPLLRFYYHAGRALHALQDAFTHTYRDPTWHKVYAVMNWMDPIRGGMDELRDGPPHETMLDKCDTERPWRTEQMAATLEASRALYRLLREADPRARDPVRAALHELLDSWLTYEGGCTVENRYCGNAVYADLQEHGLSDGTKAGGCALSSQGPGGVSEGGSCAALGLALLGLVFGQRRRRAGGRKAGAALPRSGFLALGVGVLMLGSMTAWGSPEGEHAPSSPQSAPSPAPNRASEVGQQPQQVGAGHAAPCPNAPCHCAHGAHAHLRCGCDCAAEGEGHLHVHRMHAEGGREGCPRMGGCPSPCCMGHPGSEGGWAPVARARRLHGVLRTGLSVQDPAAFVALGGIFSWRRLEVEAVAEWNPWFSVERGKTSAGTFNLYGLVAVRWPVSPKVDLQSGLGAGIAVLLFETVGTKAGNVGPYLALRPLGVTRRLGANLALTVHAFELAVPAPQTRGWPFTVPQYRMSLGLRF